jgi:hypothetical protein
MNSKQIILALVFTICLSIALIVYSHLNPAPISKYTTPVQYLITGVLIGKLINFIYLMRKP